jgi:hypothetical protein
MPSSGSPGNNVGARVFDQKMDVVGGHHIVEHGQIEPLLCFENPAGNGDGHAFLSLGSSDRVALSLNS